MNKYKKARVKMGISQAELSRRTGIADAVIRKLENILPSTFEKIEKELNMQEIDNFLNMNAEESINSKEKKLVALNKNEIIKPWTEKGYTCYVSNQGRIFNKYLTKELSLTINDQQVKFDRRLNPTTNPRRLTRNVSRLVYKLFVSEDLPDNAWVIHKDGNWLNNNAENLDVGMMRKCYNYPLPKEKQELFDSVSTIKLIKSALLTGMSPRSVCKGGRLFEDMIQESFIYVHQGLYDWDETKCKYSHFVMATVKNYVLKRYPVEKVTFTFIEDINY